MGLKPGERIFSIRGENGKQDANSIAMIRETLNEADTVTFVVGNESEKRDVTVPSQSKPRIGIAWRTNRAEPDSVTISFVYANSPASRAGIQPLDRVHQINGAKVRSGEDFRDRMKGATGSIELLIERHGKLRILQLEAEPAKPVDS